MALARSKGGGAHTPLLRICHWFPYGFVINSFVCSPVRSEDQVMREFAINLLYYFSQADSGVARTIALQVQTHLETAG